MFGNPVDEMSNAQLKEEMRALYGISDFKDCIEPGDLQKKLLNTRDTSPITHGLRYGQILQYGGSPGAEPPTGIVTFSHGLGDSAQGWSDVGAELARRLPHLLFILPTAPGRSITINGGMSIPAWYDISGMISEGLRSGRQDAVGVWQSCDYLRSLAHITAKKHSISPSRVLYAGFSQGAAISLATGLTAHVAPAGIACLSGYLAAMGDVLPRIVNKTSPIAMFHGVEDPVVPFSAAQETQKVLKSEGGVSAPIEFHQYHMQHSAVPKEIDDLEAFICRTLPKEFPSSGL